MRFLSGYSFVTVVMLYTCVAIDIDKGISIGIDLDKCRKLKRTCQTLDIKVLALLRCIGGTCHSK